MLPRPHPHPHTPPPLQTLSALPSPAWASLGSHRASVSFLHPHSFSLIGHRSDVNPVPTIVGPLLPSPLVVIIGSELPGAGSIAPVPQEASCTRQRPGDRSRCPPHRAAGGCVLRCWRHPLPHSLLCSTSTWSKARRGPPPPPVVVATWAASEECRRVIARICTGGLPLTW
jgi:hypothetical protein